MERISYAVRQSILTMLNEAGSGHTAGSLGIADVLTALYFHTLRHNPGQPDWPDRDRLILSAGHVCPALYATLAEAGYFPRKELLRLRRLGSRLQGHPHNGDLPGIETSSGPLGQGISQAIGMALAARMDHADWKTFVLMSDGEHQEGQTWEGIMFAGSRHLSNLVAIVDRNRIQIGGSTEDVMPLDPLADKYRAFNWNVMEIDGHSMPEIVEALTAARAASGMPVCIIVRTIPGKGVSFMEGDHAWHGSVPDSCQLAQALTELDKAPNGNAL